VAGAHSPDAATGQTAPAPDSIVELADAATDQASAVDLANQIIAQPNEVARQTVAALSASRSPRAAPILLVLAESQAPAALRKDARRGLHRLRSLGLEVPQPSPASAPRSTPAGLSLQHRAQLVQARASSIDGVGSRALDLVAERPAGGVLSMLLILNDVTGIKACTVQETTRRRVAAERVQREQIFKDATWVDLPTTYASQLVGEALALQSEGGLALPREFQLYRDAITELNQPFEQALIYQELSPAELELTAGLLARSPELLAEPELQGWFFGEDEMRGFALERAQARKSQIVLSEQHRAQREQRIVANAVHTVVNPPLQRGLRRRLEETSYIFWKTARLPQTQLALAAAQALEGGALTLHPLLAAMVEKSLDLADQTSGSGIPSEVLNRRPYSPIE
jgi:hypothetical protein